MQRRVIFTIVVIAVIGLLLVLSMDDDPPNDAHLTPVESAAPADDDNGYVVLVRALEAMKWPEDDAWIHELPRHELSRDPDILALVEANRDTLALIPAAAGAPAFQFPTSADVDTTTLMTRTRDLGALAAIDATIRMARGDGAAAYEPLMQYLALVHRFRSTGELIHYIIGTAHQATTLQHMVRLAADANGDALETVAERLTDFAWKREPMAGALGREYVYMTNLIATSFEQEAWSDVPVLVDYMYQPNRTRKLYADSFTVAIDGLDEDCATAPRADAEPTLSKWSYLAPNWAGRLLHNIGVPDLARFTYSRCREELSLGLTRLVLATRAYRADTGALPESLDALVPRYVTELPVDVDGRPFRYSVAEGTLYSVGDDQTDDGGGELVLDVDWSAPDPGVTLRR